VAPVPAPQKVVPSVEDVLTAMRPPLSTETKKGTASVDSGSKTAPAKTSSAAKGGLFQVQLSALRSREQADSEWDRLRRRNSDLLGSLELSVIRADLGPGKGVFFRLRAGPLADEQAAQNLCQKLTERKVGCLVVRPEG
jgi:cell division septation protein DedD